MGDDPFMYPGLKEPTNLSKNQEERFWGTPSRGGGNRKKDGFNVGCVNATEGRWEKKGKKVARKARPSYERRGGLGSFLTQ